MKIKHSKLRNFKIVTGKHYLDVTQKTNSKDAEEQLDALQSLTLGLYLLDVYELPEARKEYKRLTQAENFDELMDILDTVDVAELQNDIIG